MPSNTPLPLTFTDQNVTIRATFLINIAIPLIQERYLIRQLSLVTSRPFPPTQYSYSTNTGALFHPTTVAGHLPAFLPTQYNSSNT
jgi:hypothetical protein